eukprot:2999639-Rhodomonas_salina.1
MGGTEAAYGATAGVCGARGARRAAPAQVSLAASLTASLTVSAHSPSAICARTALLPLHVLLVHPAIACKRTQAWDASYGGHAFVHFSLQCAVYVDGAAM